MKAARLAMVRLKMSKKKLKQLLHMKFISSDEMKREMPLSVIFSLKKRFLHCRYDFRESLLKKVQLNSGAHKFKIQAT